VTRGRRAVALLLLVLALALALLGQFYFFWRRQYLWDGLVFYALAVLCFILAWRQATVLTRKPRASRRFSLQLETWIRKRPATAGLMTLGVLLSSIATLLSRGRMWNQSTGGMVILWVLGMGAVVLAVLWPESRLLRSEWDWKPRWLALDRGTWLELATVAGLTVLALTLRLASLDSIPYTLGGDEAWHGLLARQVLDGELRNPFVMGYMSMPTFFYWPLSWSLWLVGDNMTGLRLPAVLAGTITIPVLYLFARRLWGKRTAFLAALFLAAYDYHIHYSRLGANNVWDALFVLLALWTLDLGVTSPDRTKQTRFFILAGLVMGLSTYFYTGARLLPLLTITYLLFLWLKRWLSSRRVEPGTPDSIPGSNGPSPGQETRQAGDQAENSDGVRWKWRLLVLLALAFLVAAGPMLSYAQSHPNEWNARINQVGIIQSGWLAREPGLTGKGTAQILAEQFLRAAGAFHVFPDRTVWYGADRPLLGFLAGIFAALGMAWAVVHWRDRRYFLVLIWFWSVIISGGMLTESPPSSQRLVIAIPAVALLVAFGLEQTVRLARGLVGFGRKWENLALGLLVLILAASSVYFYFVQFTPSRCYGSENGETGTMIGHYLRDLEGDSQVYFFGAPQIYWKFGTMSFLAPGVSGQDVVEPLAGPPDFVDRYQSSVFVFLPARAGELDWVQQAFPDGRLREFRSPVDRLLFIVYEVP